MREILFRGKQVDKGEWVEGYVFEMHILGDKTTYISTKPFMLCNDGDFDYEPFAVDTETVGQYTGLTDKNGTKIFEGDIVKIAYYFGWDDEQEKNVPEEEYISKVYSIDGCPFCVDLLHCDGDMSPIAWLDWSYDDAEIEVIGNIHDNPELLKECEGK